jgi:glycosyltransferase involved in cell wall biosynthesis
VITDLKVGGAEIMLLKLVEAMDRQRFAPQVASLLTGGELAAPLRAAGVPVHELGARQGSVSPAAAWRLLRLARKLRPTHVQGWMYHGNLAAALVVAVAPGSVRQFWNVRQTLEDIGREAPLTRKVIGLGGRFSGRPEAVIYNAAVSRDQHLALGYRAANARLVPNGFDLDRFRPDPQAPGALRRELGLAPDTRLVGVLARHHPAKGHANFLAAGALLAARRPDLHLLCAGRGVTPENEDLRRDVDRPELAGRIHLLGPRADTPRLLAGLDLLVVPSVWEGFPNVLGEALACGTPCVATDVGESGTILADLGPVVPPNDPPALAAAMDRVLDQPSAAREATGRRGRDRVAERYSLAAVARLYEELYA